MSNLDLSGLNNFSELLKSGSDAAAKASSAANNGKPLMLSVSVIDEDPDQPRREFDQEKLQDLADSIAARGVKTPISVRTHPSETGRYIINHGARRYRASKMAGKSEVPAFVDDTHNDIDQLSENIQRDDLSVREVVDAIGRQLAAGKKQADIARELGKSRAWVSKYAALTELPDELSEVLATGQCKDASTLYEALQLWKQDQIAVLEMIIGADGRQIVKADIETLRTTIRLAEREAQNKDDQESQQNDLEGQQNDLTGEAGGEQEQSAGSGQSDGQTDGTTQTGEALSQGNSTPNSNGGSQEAGSGGLDDDGDDDPNMHRTIAPKKQEEDPTKVKKPLIQVQVGRKLGVMLFNKACDFGNVWVQLENGDLREIEAGKVKLLGVIDGAKK